MNMSKFERRRHEAQRRFDEEMKALEDAERKEVKKRIDPIVAKITKLVEEEARKALEANPDILESYSFKKREATREMRAMLGRVFESDSLGGAEDDTDSREDSVDPVAGEATPDTQDTPDTFAGKFTGSDEGNSSGADDRPDPGHVRSEDEKKGFGPFRR